MAFEHKNSKGDTYYLHGKDVTLRNGRLQKIFYFARSEKEGDTLNDVPTGYSVGENQRTGLPFLTKADKAKADTAKTDTAKTDTAKTDKAKADKK